MSEKKELKEEDIKNVSGGVGEDCDYYCYSCNQIFSGGHETIKCPLCGSDNIGTFGGAD